MTGEKTTTGTEQGTYSRRRLLIIATLWMIAGSVVLAFSPVFLASADDRGCFGPPCAFPAENNVGGIILGSDELAGQDLVTFGYDGNGPDSGYYVDPVSPDRVINRERMVGVGINDVTSGNFIVYKPWHYFDTRTREEEEVYVWANATSAELTGSSECGDGSDGWDGAFRCDLVANASELSARELFVTTSCSSWFCGFVPDSFSPTDYHEPNVEEDTCGAFDGLGGDVCLSLISDGGTSVAGTTVTADSVDAFDIMIRAHTISAKRGDQSNDKQLTLNNAYLEMRYGEGFDRAKVPVSQSGGAADWAQPIQTQYGKGAVSVSHTCQGGGPDTSCNIKDGRVTDVEPPATYDNVHLP